jgi:hypothetical protein
MKEKGPNFNEPVFTLTKNTVDGVVLPGVTFVSTTPSQEPADGAHRWRAVLVADTVLRAQKRALVGNGRLGAEPFLRNCRLAVTQELPNILWSSNNNNNNNNTLAKYQDSVSTNCAKRHLAINGLQNYKNAILNRVHFC